MTQQTFLQKNIFSGRVAAFVDAANLEKSVADLGTVLPNLKKIPKGFRWKSSSKGSWNVDYKKLHKFFTSRSTLVSLSFYTARFNTESHDKFLVFLKKEGFRLVTKPIKEIVAYDGKHRKANFDVEIAVDAVSWLRHYDTLVLMSGDSDFAYLLHWLKKRKKQTVVISRRGHISRELISVADRYLDIYKLKELVLRQKKQKSR